MVKRTGKIIRISPFRRLVIDLMSFSQKVPAVTADRRMSLGTLVDARQACFPRPTWTALFTKAHAIVSSQEPRLRRCYMSFPFARFFEYNKTVATLNILRCVDGEDIVLHAHVRSPENRTLPQIDEIIRYFMDTPVEQIDSYRRVRRVSYLPGPIRRFIMWASLNAVGRQRCHNYGTFGITSVASQGAGLLNLVPLLTSTIHYGLFDAKGTLDVRLSFDHRVIDGALAAESLQRLETTLLGEVLDEVRALPKLRRPMAA